MPVSPERAISTPKETEAFNLLNYLLKEAKSYSEVETKEAQRLLGLKELTVVNASKEFEVTIDWGKVSQLPDIELLEGEKLGIIFVDELTPTMKKELAKQRELATEFTAITPDGQMVMIFQITGVHAVSLGTDKTLPENLSDEQIRNLIFGYLFLHELTHVLQVCRLEPDEFSKLCALEADLPPSEHHLEIEASEYARENLLPHFMDGVQIRPRPKEESRLTPQGELEVQAFFHWLGVRQRLLEGKDEAPYFLRSKV